MGSGRWHKALSQVAYLGYLVGVVVAIDVVVLRHLLGFGYPKHYEEARIFRHPRPYVMFTGQPNIEDHNAQGFRGKTLESAPEEAFKIAFFGGSTGYLGDPPIPVVLEAALAQQLETPVFVANYSVVSSTHRQHLHGLLEYLPSYRPDLVVFYGGYNETIQPAYYDPRPGYPYNFFYTAETSPLTKLLVQNSAILGELDKAFGWFTGLGQLRQQEQPLSEDWNRRIQANYLETLALAQQFSGAIASNRCGSTQFLAFYQPSQVPEAFESAHASLRQQVDSLAYTIDVSDAFDDLGEEVYTDIVHVKQVANDRMGQIMADRIQAELESGTLQACEVN